MGHVVFAMHTSLDGYVSGASGGPEDFPTPGEELHQHFNDLERNTALSIYGRAMYGDMRYWDTDDPDWEPVHRDYAEAWRATPKVVVSTTLTEVGPNATLVSQDVDAELRRVVESTDGEIEVAGPTLASTLTRLGLIDEYRLYQRPVAFGAGKAFFATDARTELTLLGVETLAEDTVLIRYAPLR